MEPMTLGSPVGSPSSPTCPVPVTSPFLPAYLMGESSVTNGVQSKSISPMKPQKQVSFAATPTLSPPKPTHGTLESRLALPLTPVEKNSGPPIRALFDTLDESFASPKTGGFEDLSFQEMNESLLVMPPSVERSTMSAEEQWVTVFGFPASSASFVASQFSQCGTIMDKKCPPKGNWMHLRFQSPMEVRKALANNGRVFPGGIMVGVMPCKDQEVLGSFQTKENMYQGLDYSLNSSRDHTADTVSQFGSPFSTLNNQHNSSAMSYLGTPVRLSNARPLGQAYRTAQAESEVLTQSNTPQKSTSMVTKAMEYVFGW